MMNRIKILLLFLKTIKYYGYINSIKIFYYEFKNLILLRDLVTFDYNEDQTSSYNKSKKLGKYDVPYIPTPYYFLNIIKNFLLKKSINKFILIDIGCGYCRPNNFFSKKFKIKFYGIEINKKIIEIVNKKRSKKLKLFNFNIRNLKKTTNFLNKNLSKKFINIIFISDTVEINLINIIIDKIKNNHKVYLILINIKFKLLNSNKFMLTKKIIFKDKSKNILFLKNFKN